MFLFFLVMGMNHNKEENTQPLLIIQEKSRWMECQHSTKNCVGFFKGKWWKYGEKIIISHFLCYD